MATTLLNSYIMKDLIGVGLILGLEVIDYVRKSRNIMVRITIVVIGIMVLIFKICLMFLPRSPRWSLGHVT